MKSDEGPALLRHCHTIYSAMCENAALVEGHTIYEGRLTELFRSCDLATPYYTTVMRELRAMRCVEQLSRGGGGAPSRWRLVTPPTQELWDGDKKYNTTTGNLSRTERYEQRIRDLHRLVNNLQAVVDDLLDRVQCLEAK